MIRIHPTSAYVCLCSCVSWCLCVTQSSACLAKSYMSNPTELKGEVTLCESSMHAAHHLTLKHINSVFFFFFKVSSHEVWVLLVVHWIIISYSPRTID